MSEATKLVVLTVAIAVLAVLFLILNEYLAA